MVKKCIYCKSEVNDDCVIDFCERCGIQVWGEKMFKTILKNMEDARSNGDLLHNRKDFCIDSDLSHKDLPI
jgi:rRNA maturation endonuclease Nob1